MQPLIEFKNADFTVGEKNILNNITLSIFPGEFVVILGGNGSGKSSLLKLLNHTYHTTAGNIIFKQQPVQNYSLATLRNQIATITQSISDSIFLDLTVEENALLIEASRITADNNHFNKKRFLSTLPDYLKQFNPKLTYALKTHVNKLSGGEQQLLALALYLRDHPDLLLLDEHTSALDPKKSDVVMEFTNHYILQNHITCLMTTHELQYALKYGNRLIALREGKIIFEANAAEKSQLTMQQLLRHCY